jgi:hypothetical protein
MTESKVTTGWLKSRPTMMLRIVPMASRNRVATA